MILPKEKVLIEKIETSFVDVVKIVNEVRVRRLTGYLLIKYETDEDIMLFKEGELITAVFSDAEGKIGGERAIPEIIRRARSEGGNLSIYQLSEDILNSIVGYVLGRVLYENLKSTYLQFNKLLANLSDEGYTGCITIESGDKSGMVLMDEGKPVGAYFENGEFLKGSEALNEIIYLGGKEDSLVNVWQSGEVIAEEIEEEFRERELSEMRGYEAEEVVERERLKVSRQKGKPEEQVTEMEKELEMLERTTIRKPSDLFGGIVPYKLKLPIEDTKRISVKGILINANLRYLQERSRPWTAREFFKERSKRTILEAIESEILERKVLRDPNYRREKHKLRRRYFNSLSYPFDEYFDITYTIAKMLESGWLYKRNESQYQKDWVRLEKSLFELGKVTYPMIRLERKSGFFQRKIPSFGLSGLKGGEIKGEFFKILDDFRGMTGFKYKILKSRENMVSFIITRDPEPTARRMGIIWSILKSLKNGNFEISQKAGNGGILYEVRW